MLQLIYQCCPCAPYIRLHRCIVILRVILLWEGKDVIRLGRGGGPGGGDFNRDTSNTPHTDYAFPMKDHRLHYGHIDRFEKVICSSFCSAEHNCYRYGYISKYPWNIDTYLSFLYIFRFIISNLYFIQTTWNLYCGPYIFKKIKSRWGR